MIPKLDKCYMKGKVQVHFTHDHNCKILNKIFKIVGYWCKDGQNIKNILFHVQVEFVPGMGQIK